jgi:hypothetical protein
VKSLPVARYTNTRCSPTTFALGAVMTLCLLGCTGSGHTPTADPAAEAGPRASAAGVASVAGSVPEPLSARPPLWLDATHPAIVLVPGAHAVMPFDDPSSWQVTSDGTDVVELLPAQQHAGWESHHGLRARAPGRARIEARSPADRLIFSVVVDAAGAAEVDYPLTGSGYSLRLPALMAERLVLVPEENDYTRQMQASFAATVRFRSPGTTTWDGSPLYVAYFQRVPIEVWERVQAEGGPPIGFEMARSEGQVLLHSPPHDLPYPERFGDEANLYLTTAAMLGEAERLVEIRP